MEFDQEYNVNYEYILRYIRDTIRPYDGILREMLDYAKANEVPVSRPECMRLIEVLLKLSGAKQVLEVGAAIGFSAVAMAMCGVSVTTIERDEDMLKALHTNLQKSGMADRVTVLEGDAEDLLSQLDGCYDFIFLDASKGHYQDFLPHLMRLLRPGGLLFSDNVLYQGMVATDELVQHRKITIVKRMRAYLDTICNSDVLDTALLPIGDGVALSYKRSVTDDCKA